MLGSTFIAEKDRARLASITSPEDVADFAHVYLDAMTTIDFQTLTAAGKVKWADGKPVWYDPDEGVALFKVSEAGLSHLVDNAATVPEEHREDVRKLAEFVARHGKAHIYELATF